MTLYKWSQTAASNASADSTISIPEGMSPAGVNDGMRAMMAAIAKFRDDTSGKLVTGGTSTAYTLTTNQVFDSQAHMALQCVAFRPHATSGASPTLNVDGLGAFPLVYTNGAAIPTGALLVGNPYHALFIQGVEWRLFDYYFNLV